MPRHRQFGGKRDTTARGILRALDRERSHRFHRFFLLRTPLMRAARAAVKANTPWKRPRVSLHNQAGALFRALSAFACAT